MMKFGILIFDGVEELDFVGPWELLKLWSSLANGPEECLIVSEHPRPIECAKGLSVNAHATFADCPPLDYLLIPGGMGTRKEVTNTALLQFVSSQAENTTALLSVCTGSFVLQAAGLLSGRKATTHWGSLDRLRAFDDTEVVEERFVRDGSVWTAAGVSAGIDLMLAFIADTAGETAAGKVQAQAEYYPAGGTYGDFAGTDSAPGYLKDVR